MTYWKTEHFRALQKAWYRRLETDGFRDAEEKVADEMVLRQTSAHPYQGLDQTQREIKEAYYRLLAQQVQEAEFRNEIDRFILTRFSEGAKIKAICQELKSIGKSRDRRAIRFRIRVYEMEWGLREYTEKQLDRRRRAS